MDQVDDDAVDAEDTPFDVELDDIVLEVEALEDEDETLAKELLELVLLKDEAVVKNEPAVDINVLELVPEGVLTDADPVEDEAM